MDTERVNEPSRDGAARHGLASPARHQQLAGLHLPRAGAAPALGQVGDTRCPMPGSGDLVASAPERWCLARETLMSKPRIKSERQKSNAQNGGQEDKGVLLSCSRSDFVKISDGFS